MGTTTVQSGYTLNGEPLNLAAFLARRSVSEEVRDAIDAMRVGEVVTVAGEAVSREKEDTGTHWHCTTCGADGVIRGPHGLPAGNDQIAYLHRTASPLCAGDLQYCTPGAGL